MLIRIRRPSSPTMAVVTGLVKPTGLKLLQRLTNVLIACREAVKVLINLQWMNSLAPMTPTGKRRLSRNIL